MNEVYRQPVGQVKLDEEVENAQKFKERSTINSVNQSLRLNARNMKRRASSSSASGIQQRKVERRQNETKQQVSRKPSTSTATSRTNSTNKLTQDHPAHGSNSSTSSSTTSATTTKPRRTSSRKSRRSNTDEDAKKTGNDNNNDKVKEETVEVCNNSSSANPDQIIDGEEWNYLPHAVLTRMFMYLDPIDRRRASTTCKRWRECYFYPNLWRDVQLCVTDKWGWNAAQVVAERCGKYARRLSIFPTTHLDCVKNFTIGITSGHVKSQFHEPALLLGISEVLAKLKDQSKNLENFQLNWIDDFYRRDFRDEEGQDGRDTSLEKM